MIKNILAFLFALSFYSVGNAAEGDGCAQFELEDGRISIPIQVAGGDSRANISIPK